MILQLGNHCSNSGICPTSTGNFTQARSQPLNRVISSIKVLAITPRFPSDPLIRREISPFSSGSSATSIRTNLQKTPSNPGIAFLAKHSSTILSTFSSQDKSPTDVRRKYRKSLCALSLRNLGSVSLIKPGHIAIMLCQSVLPLRCGPTMNIGGFIRRFLSWDNCLRLIKIWPKVFSSLESQSRREELNAPSAAYDAIILPLNYAGQP